MEHTGVDIELVTITMQRWQWRHIAENIHGLGSFHECDTCLNCQEQIMKAIE